VILDVEDGRVGVCSALREEERDGVDVVDVLVRAGLTSDLTG